jgi:hypothetical protein
VPQQQDEGSLMMNKQDATKMWVVLQELQTANSMMQQGVKLLEEALTDEEDTGNSMQIAKELIEERLQRLVGDFLSIMAEGL